MLETLDLYLPMFLVFIFHILDERWRKKIDISLGKHTLIIFVKIAVPTLISLFLLFLFGIFLKATEYQLLPIIAIGFSGSYVLTCYYLEPFYSKK